MSGPVYMELVRLHRLQERLTAKQDEIAVMYERLEELKITSAGRPEYLEKLILLTTATALKYETVARLAREIQQIKTDQRSIIGGMGL